MAVAVFGFWVALNGRLTAEIFLIGAALTGLILLFMCRFCEWSLKKEGKIYVALPLLIGYFFGLIWEIVKANLSLCRVVYVGRPEPVVRVIKTELRTRLGKMLLANSITLTPGTVTLDVRGDEVTVHCLTEKMAQGLDGLVFEKRLKKLEAWIGG